MRSAASSFAAIVFTLAVAIAARVAHSDPATSARAGGGPPVAPRVPVVDDYFGTKITDDYRWMEDRHAPKFEQWCREQGRYARSVLDRIPGRDALQARIAAHTGGGTVATQVHQAGGKVFYLKLEPGQDTFKLYVRDGVDGAESLLVDPDKDASPAASRPGARRRASSTSSTSRPGASGQRRSIAPTTAAPRGARTIARSTTTDSPRWGRTPRTPSST